LSSDGEEFIPYAVVNKVLSFWQDVLMVNDKKLNHSCYMKTTFPSSPAELANKSQTKKKKKDYICTRLWTYHANAWLILPKHVQNQRQ